MQGEIDGRLGDRKETLKSHLQFEGKDEFNGLKVSTSKEQFRYTFNPERAVEKLGNTKYAQKNISVKSKVPASEIPEEVLAQFETYFDFEVKLEVSEGNAKLAIENGDCEKDDVYDKGKRFCSLYARSKKSDTELVDIYRGLGKNVDTLLLE